MMKTAKLLVIVSAIFILAAFFLPWLSVSINNQNVLNRSGLDLAQGHYGLSEIINSKNAVSYDGFMTEQLLQDILNESVGTMIDVLGLSVAEASLYLVPAFAVILIILSLVSSWKPSISYSVLLLVLSGLMIFYLGYKISIIMFSDRVGKLVDRLLGFGSNGIPFDLNQKIGLGIVLSCLGTVGTFFGGFMAWQSYEEDKRVPQFIRLIPEDLDSIWGMITSEKAQQPKPGTYSNYPGVMQPVHAHVNRMETNRPQQYQPDFEQTWPNYPQHDQEHRYKAYVGQTYQPVSKPNYPQQNQRSMNPPWINNPHNQQMQPNQPLQAYADVNQTPPNKPQSLIQETATEVNMPDQSEEYLHHASNQVTRIPPQPAYIPPQESLRTQPFTGQDSFSFQTPLTPTYSQPGSIANHAAQMPANRNPSPNAMFLPQRNPMTADYPPDPQGRPVNNWRPLKSPNNLRNHT